MILSRIQGAYEGLSDSEKLAARYIIERPDDVIHYSITEFARFSGSSEATIYRMCKKLGFDGYQQFKIALAREVSFPAEAVVQTSGKQTTKDIISAIFAENLDLIRRTREILETEVIEGVVDMILEATSVLFFAVGRSAPIAVDGCLRFALLGIPSASYNDPHAQVMVASGLKESDIVIGVSHSGMIRDLVKSMEVAQESMARTVAITAGIDSPMTRFADAVLYCGTTTKGPSYLVTNRIGELVVVDVLYKLLMLKIGSDIKPHFDNLSEALKPKRF